MTLKLCGSVSVAIPVELRQPRANSLAVGCDGSSLGEGLSCRGKFGKVFFFGTGMGAMCAERHKSPSRV